MPYASGLGASLGFGVEGTPGTEAVPTAWYEFLSESMQLVPTYLDSAGLKAGQAFKRGARTQISRYDVNGDITVEHSDRGFSAALGRGMGFLWHYALGSPATGAQQLGATSAWQQVHVPGTTAGLSLTCEVGRPQVASPYTSNAFRYSGVKFSGWEFTCSDGQLAQLKLTADGWTTTTTASLTSPAFAASTYQSGVFSFADAYLFQIGTGVATGTGSLPGTGGTGTGTGNYTTLTGTANVAHVVKGFTLTTARPLAGDRYGFGSAGVKREQLENGIPTLTGTLGAEFTNRTEFYDLFSSNATRSLQLDFAHGISGSGADGAAGSTGTGAYRLSFVLPYVKFKTDPLSVTGPDLIPESIGFECYDDGSGQAGGSPLQIRLVSQDQAF
jgi:Phage tail tube protein